MKIIHFYSKRILKNKYKNPFSAILDSKIVVKGKGEILDIDLDQISNVRFVKKRNFTSNFLVFIFTTLPCYFLFIFSEIYSIPQFLSVLIIGLLFLISFSIKKYSYVLLINNSNLSFIEFEVAEQDVIHIELFVSIFKNKRGLNNFDFDI